MTQADCNISIQSEKSLSRRAALTGAAAIVVAGPVAASAAPDPIFAAIEKYRRADEHHGHCCDRGEEEAFAAGDASFDAMFDMAETVPTTAAGAIALLKFIENKIVHREEALIDFLDPREENSLTPALIASLCAFLGRQA